ncbi:ATPase, vacuolar ER assembly factor, Vma12 [Melia azedarach]|uniref:ATPase, vacuolar ER assembly factor, Vma12 n=1 Tax=Melia azedarach TaxID=155640 RepID=A0ACC1YY46_MELAZ|nr:ATPase, vacuolar ER assembly factor, Vma12 [Melia azedarach]
MGSDFAQNSAGLIIFNSESIRSFLLSASEDPQLSPELQATASNLSSLSNVPYKSIRSIWVESNPSIRPDLFSLFSLSEFVFTSPKPREKSEELKARLRKLVERAEREEYRELVKDIMPKNDTTEPFSSYKDQLGFGLHVALTMFTGYLVGYAAFRALFGHSPAMSAAGGMLGLVFGMLVETLLFIIRSSDQDPKSSSSASKLKKNQ